MPSYTRWSGQKGSIFCLRKHWTTSNVKLYDNGLNEKFEFVLQIASSELILPKINTLFMNFHWTLIHDQN